MEQGFKKLRSSDFAGSTAVINELKEKYKGNYNQLGLNSYIKNIRGCQTGEEGVQLKIFQDMGIIGDKGYCVDFGGGDIIY